MLVNGKLSKSKLMPVSGMLSSQGYLSKSAGDVQNHTFEINVYGNMTSPIRLVYLSFEVLEACPLKRYDQLST